MHKYLSGLLIVPFILIFLASGYWVGNNPQYYQKYLDLYKTEILFYSPDSAEMFPPAFQLELQKKSKVKIHFITSDPEAADILLVDQDFLKSKLKNSRSVFNSGNQDWNQLFNLISPDFQRDLFKATTAIPVLWKMDKDRLKILSLVVDANQNKRSNLLWNFVELLLNDQIYSHWLGFQSWNTTLMKFDEGSLSESRKASSIRKFNLNQIDFTK